MHKYYVVTMQKWYLENKGVQIKRSFFFVPCTMVSLNKLKLLCTHGWPRTFADERLVLKKKEQPKGDRFWISTGLLKGHKQENK